MKDEKTLTRDELIVEAFRLIRESNAEDLQKALAAALAIPDKKSA